MGLKNLLEKQPPSHGKKKQYNFHQMIGEGTFGEVKQATWTRPPDGKKEEVAVKCIQKKLVKSKPSVVQDETDVLQGLSHPHVIKILDFFESKDKYYLTFELVEGGELFDAIVARHHFSEHDAATVVAATLSAVKYLHGKNICHRDLKPENLLLRTKDKNKLDEIVLCDFGVARHLHDGVDLNKTLVGSPGYSAPELYDKNGYKGQPADIWSIGVITYALLSGTTPFKSKDPEQMLREQMKGEIKFDRAIWESISDEAKDFIRRCCRVKASERMTAAEACEHPWIQHETVRSGHDLGDDMRKTLSRHVEDGGGTRYNSRRPLNPSEQEVYTDSSASETSSMTSSEASSEASSLTSKGSDTSREVDNELAGKVSAIEV